jgi:hypothetical protein
MITGFFCTFAATASACLGLPAHQQLVESTVVDTGCPGTVLSVTVDGRRVANYVDDSLGSSEAAAQACAAADGLPVYAGEYGHDYGLPNGLVEWYPIADQGSVVGNPPPPGQAGYILQAFSWGDNLSDGEAMGRCTSSDSTASCAAKYRAPSASQLEQMWCAVQQYSPHLVLWYYAGGVPTDDVLQAMARPCPAPRPITNPPAPSPGSVSSQSPSEVSSGPPASTHHAAKHKRRHKRHRAHHRAVSPDRGGKHRRRHVRERPHYIRNGWLPPNQWP